MLAARNTPAEQLGRLLAEAKRSGVEWAEAWPAALEEVEWPDREWCVAINSTTEDWRRAYLDLEPTPAAERLAALVREPGEDRPLLAA